MEYRGQVVWGLGFRSVKFEVSGLGYSEFFLRLGVLS